MKQSRTDTIKLKNQMDYLPNTDSLTSGQLHKTSSKGFWIWRDCRPVRPMYLGSEEPRIKVYYLLREEVINRHAIKENIISVSYKITEEQNFRFKLFNKFQRNAKFY